jgi:lysine 2,3-aminomutase
MGPNRDKNMTHIKSAYSVSELMDLDLIPKSQDDQWSTLEQKYAIAITPTILKQINLSPSHDPIAQQFIPSLKELDKNDQELEDPIGDYKHTKTKGLVHRYPDRVLFKIVHICPVYCRFCFRREMIGPNGDGSLSPQDIHDALNYINNHKEIWEVILTGGDPLILSPRRLKIIISGLNKIEHVKIIRIHSRVPLVEPSFINDALLETLTSSSKAIYIAVHANHKNEFSKDGIKALKKLNDANISLISQTVLLRGVNDNLTALIELMKCFTENHIKPYYIHHLDHAKGTEHFRISVQEGRELIYKLRGYISGLCQPHYMLDIPGGYGKIDLNSDLNIKKIDNGYILTDYLGNEHFYND